MIHFQLCYNHCGGLMLDYSLLYPLNTTTRFSMKLDGMWKFAIDFDSVGMEGNWASGVPGHDMIPVPASFQDFYTDKSIREFAGDVWYETDVMIPSSMKGKKVFIRFGAATHRAEVFLNGRKVAQHEGGFLPFLADITDSSDYGRVNRLVVKVNNELTETNIPCGMNITLSNGRKMNKPYFDFFNYSGLQRSVYLMAVPEGGISDIDFSFSVAASSADIAYAIKTGESGSILLELFDEDGVLAASAEGKDGVIHLENPHLWNVRDAYLYEAVITQKENGEIVDTYSIPVGIREVRIRGTEILINGSPVYLKGFGKHEDNEITGRGFSFGVMKRDYELMKWIGANSFRTSHYPYDEEMYRMADREGFLIIDEVPAVGLFESLTNFFDAGTGKGAHSFFSKPTTPVLLNAHLKAVEEMIQRDKNHPSVIAWSLLNEPESTDENSVPYFTALFDLARDLDVQKRPRTFAMEVSSSPTKCKCYHLSDFISLNRYYGWYILGGYEITEAEERFRKEMDEWQSLNLGKPFIFSEYGADTLSTEHKIPSVMWSQEYQCEMLEMLHRVFDSYSFVKGEQVWNFADFQTTEGLMRVNGNKKGIFTRSRQPKDAAYLLKRRWENLPLDYKSEGK